MTAQELPKPTVSTLSVVVCCVSYSKLPLFIVVVKGNNWTKLDKLGTEMDCPPVGQNDGQPDSVDYHVTYWANQVCAVGVYAVGF